MGTFFIVRHYKEKGMKIVFENFKFMEFVKNHQQAAINSS